MVYPLSRSMNADLSEGMTDGEYKKYSPNRGGVIEPTTRQTRSDLEAMYYGFQDKPIKVASDGLLHAGRR